LLGGSIDGIVSPQIAILAIFFVALFIRDETLVFLCAVREGCEHFESHMALTGIVSKEGEDDFMMPPQMSGPRV
jgi:hypothetical protein